MWPWNAFSNQWKRCHFQTISTNASECLRLHVKGESNRWSPKCSEMDVNDDKSPRGATSEYIEVPQIFVNYSDFTFTPRWQHTSNGQIGWTLERVVWPTHTSKIDNRLRFSSDSRRKSRRKCQCDNTTRNVFALAILLILSGGGIVTNPNEFVGYNVFYINSTTYLENLRKSEVNEFYRKNVIRFCR